MTGIRSFWIAFIVLSGVPGCFPPDDGRDPPLDRIYFPVGVAVDDNGERLYVVNSDFDLQFNAGSLQVYDIGRIKDFVDSMRDNADAPCKAAKLGEQSAADRLLYPGRCGPLDPVSPPSGDKILIDKVGIGAFVTDVAYRKDPNGTGQRLFMPVRGDATLHWADVSGGEGGPEVDCGQEPGGSCDDAHRRGDDPAEENTRNVSLPPEPFAVAVDEAGEAILTTHQSSGQVALFVNDWGGGASGGPQLEDVRTVLSTGVMGAAAVPPPAIARLDRSTPFSYQPSFLVTFRTSANVQQVQFFDEKAASPGRPFIQPSIAVPVTSNALGFDSRGIAVDGTARRACEQLCPPECLREHDCSVFDPETQPQERMQCDDEVARCSACLTENACASVPVDVYVANRAPPTLLVGKTDSDETLAGNDLPTFFAPAVPLSAGASRVVIGDVIDKEGNEARRVFVVSFDSRRIFVYNPDAERQDFEAVIHTGRGPHAFTTTVIEEPGTEPGTVKKTALGFIGHFTDSYIGVVDLNLGHIHNYEIVLTVGRPTPPRASK